jgi:hypothetical protein
MPDMDYPDESVVKEEMRKIVSREVASVFDTLDREQAKLETLAAGLDGPYKEDVEKAVLKVRQGKLEAITLFKAMHDFLA